MDLSVIYSKTGKGMRTLKSRDLPSHLMRVLSLIDGKSKAETLLAQSGGVTEQEMTRALAQLEGEGYIRPLLTRAVEEHWSPSNTFSPMVVEEVYEVEEIEADTLDFTDYTATEAKKEAERKTHEEAERKARAEAEAKAEAERKALEEAKAREKAEAEARAKMEAERKAREQEARAKAEAEHKARVEAEAKAETERKAKAEAEARAKAEAERKAREEAERKAREEAEAKVKAEAARKAKEEEEARVKAEAKAKAEAERKAREEAERKALEEAKAREKAEAEARAKMEAEVRAKAEAERKAKEEAEAKAKAEAERKAKEEVEARAKEAAERKAREEAERKAREAAEAAAKAEAEAKAKAEAERKAKEEEKARAKAEAERKAHEEAEVRKEAKRKAREEAEAEAQAKAEAKRKAKEEATAAKASAEAERKAQKAAEALIKADAKTKPEARHKAGEETGADAERKAREAMEAQFNAELERRKQEEAEIQARTEAERKAREQGSLDIAEIERKAREEAEAEEQAERRAKEEARARAETERREKEEAQARLKAATQAEAEQLASEEAEATARAEAEVERRMREEMVVRGRERLNPAIIGKLVRVAAVGLSGTILLLLVLLHVVNLSWFIPMEKLVSDRIGEPVTIGSVHSTLLPSPHLLLEDVSIGKEKDIKIAEIRAVPVLATLLDNAKVFKYIEIDSLAIPVENVERAAKWLEAGSNPGNIRLGRIYLKSARVAVQGLELPSFNADIALDKSDHFESAELKSTDDKITVKVNPRFDALQLELAASSWQPPIGAKFVFDQLDAKATANRQGVQITEIDGRIHEGKLKGTASVNWQNQWSANGDFELSNANLASLTTFFTPDAALAGRLDLKGTYSAQSNSLPNLLDRPSIKADFSCLDGSIGGVDLVRLLLQGGGRVNSGEKTTKYTNLTGNMALTDGHYQFRQIKLTGKQLSASGEVDMAPNKTLSGNITADFAVKSRKLHGQLTLSGSLKQPQLQ